MNALQEQRPHMDVQLTVAKELSGEPLRNCVRRAMDEYFERLDGHAPNGLYQMVIAEVEQPLLETVLRQASGNQTRAAEMLGINRGTLRRKLSQYGI